MIITAKIISRIKRKAFCGMSGECEYFVVDHPQIQMIPVADFRRSVEDGDAVQFAYVATNNGYRWLPQ